MPKEIFPSSYLCDCGHQSDFFENTIREAKAMSQKKKVYLADSAPEEHTIVFYRGRMVDIQCPKQPQSHATQIRPGKKRATTRGIPDEVKTHVAAIVERFNTATIRTPIVCTFRAIGASFSTWIGRIMDVSHPFVGWSTRGKWRIGLSPSTSTAMSAMMRRNGSFQELNTSMAPLKAR